MRLNRTAVRGVLGVTVTVLSLCAVDTVGTWLIQESALEAVREKNTVASVQGWSELLADPVKQEDWARVGFIVECAVNDERIWRLTVQDARGRAQYRFCRAHSAAISGKEDLTDAAARSSTVWPGSDEGHRVIHIPIVESRSEAGGSTGQRRVEPAVGFLVAELADGDGDPVVRAARQRLLVLGAVLLVGAGFLLWWINNMHVGTIGKLANRVNGLARGRPAEPLDEAVAASWTPLVHAIDGLGDELARRREQLDRSDKELEERVALRTRDLHDIAIRDPLTGLYNRRYLNEALQQRAAEAARYHSNISVLMIDLDDLKRLNDTFGHQAGDEALILLASVVSSQLRSADVAGRYGGDEFAVLLPHTDPADAEIIARRICEQYRTACAAELPQAHATLSIGVASLKAGQVPDLNKLIRYADAALYRAKADGKGRVVRFGEADLLRFAPA